MFDGGKAVDIMSGIHAFLLGYGGRFARFWYLERAMGTGFDGLYEEVAGKFARKRVISGFILGHRSLYFTATGEKSLGKFV